MNKGHVSRIDTKVEAPTQSAGPRKRQVATEDLAIYSFLKEVNSGDLVVLPSIPVSAVLASSRISGHDRTRQIPDAAYCGETPCLSENDLQATQNLREIGTTCKRLLIC